MSVTDREILEAVAAVETEMLDVLARLVEAPTTLANEEPGQVVVEEAFRDLLGLEPYDIGMDAEILRADPRAAPFDWDLTGKRNVVADWPGAGGRGRSLVLNGHVDVVGPASTRLWRTPPFSATHDGDWLYGRGANPRLKDEDGVTASAWATKNNQADLANVLREAEKKK